MSSKSKSQNTIVSGRVRDALARYSLASLHVRVTTATVRVTYTGGALAHVVQKRIEVDCAVGTRKVDVKRAPAPVKTHGGTKRIRTTRATPAQGKTHAAAPARKAAPAKAAPKKSAPKKSTARKTAPQCSVETWESHGRTYTAIVIPCTGRPFRVGRAKAALIVENKARIAKFAKTGKGDFVLDEKYQMITLGALSAKRDYTMGARKAKLAHAHMAEIAAFAKSVS